MITVTTDVIDEAVYRLVERFDPEKIILFGSRARGTACEKSDVDLLILCRSVPNRRQLVREMDRTLRGLKLPRDIVVLSVDEFERDKEIPGTLARPAWQEGKVLYDRVGC